MANKNETESLKEDIKKANESIKSSVPEFVEQPILQGKVLDINPPRKSQASGLIGEIENKSIEAQANGNASLHGELEKLLGALGELKAKVEAFDKRFEQDCSDILKHIKVVLFNQ